MAEVIQMTAKDLIRSKTVGAAKDFKREIMEFEGVPVEIKEPSERQRAKIFERARSEINVDGGKPKINVDTAELAVWALICCVHDPETGETVFTEADYETLMNMPASQLDKLKSKALEYVNVDREALEKNSK